MPSPLELFNGVAKDFGITADKQLHERQKQAFVESQVGEQKAVINRLIVDAAKARYDLANAKDDVSKAAYQGNVSKFENDLRQFSSTLAFFQELASELGIKYDSEPSDESL